jgi:peptide deformylase
VPARPVLLYPDPALKAVAAPVQASEVDSVAGELLATMSSYERCVGLAAPQISLPVRVVVVDVSDHPKAETSNGLLVLANPRVVAAEGSEVGREGCLSLPDFTANVRRATRVVVEHLGGTVKCQGFEARAVQHELDHLDGILFLDRVESLVDDVFRRRSYAGSPPDPPGSSGGGGGASSKDSPGRADGLRTAPAGGPVPESRVAPFD